MSDERRKERQGEDGSYRVHVGGCSSGRKGERAVYRMHIEASFHGHRRPWSRSPGLDTRSVNGGKVVRLNVAKEWHRFDGCLCILGGGGYVEDVDKRNKFVRLKFCLYFCLLLMRNYGTRNR